MILQTLLKVLNVPQIELNKVHDFRKYKRRKEFFVEFYDSYNSAKMVSSIIVRTGERVILQEQESVMIYCVAEIEYYSNSNSILEVSLKIDTEAELTP